MNKEKKKKVKLIVRTFLSANKGKSFTAKEICDFINFNNLGVRDGIKTDEFGGIIDYNFCRAYRINRERKNARNIYHYSMGDVNG